MPDKGAWAVVEARALGLQGDTISQPWRLKALVRYLGSEEAQQSLWFREPPRVVLCHG